MTEIAIVTRLQALAERYDALIVDLWGVLHDGVRPYPGVVDALRALRAAGKKLCALSNAPRRVDRVARQMDEIGLSPELVDAIYSSGEATWEALDRKRWDAPEGERCFHIGKSDDAHLISANHLRLVDRPRDAELVLCTGTEADDDTLEDHQPTLDACLRLELPLVCANPDLKVMHGDRWKVCAGALAAYYEEGGGTAIYFGKPYRPVYDRCLEILATPPGRVLAVGDSFRTDVAGANGAGLDCLLIAGGLNAAALLPADHDNQINADALERLADKWGHRPRYAAPRFIW